MGVAAQAGKALCAALHGEVDFVVAGHRHAREDGAVAGVEDVDGGERGGGVAWHAGDDVWDGCVLHTIKLRQRRNHGNGRLLQEEKRRVMNDRRTALILGGGVGGLDGR